MKKILVCALAAVALTFTSCDQTKKAPAPTEGTEVVTGGGIHGTVKSIDLAKNTVDVKIARDVVITVEKSMVFKDASSQLQK